MESNKNENSKPLVSNLIKRTNSTRDEEDNPVTSDKDDLPSPMKR